MGAFTGFAATLFSLLVAAAAIAAVCGFGHALLSNILLIYDRRARRLDAQGYDAFHAELPAVRTEEFWEGVALEGLHSWLNLMAYPFGLLDLDSLFSRKGSGPPILFVHGYLQNRSNWYVMMSRLRRLGVGPLYSMNLNPPFSHIETYGGQIRDRVEQIRRETGAQKVILVAHSMGGLASRHYIARLGGDGHVERLITLGSPHQGTRFAMLALGPNALQMVPSSRFLLELAESEKGRPLPPVTVIYSNHDSIVFPPENCELAHASEVLRVNHTGHMSLFFHDGVFSHLAARLRPGLQVPA
ncbi:MAG: hypothetical protein GMKNLPBB_00296 [Myxococcota bacterium]|nr:hypothetical protein [Myxococcota bacterium]